jgi:ribosome biogenesis protein YTM1
MSIADRGVEVHTPFDFLIDGKLLRSSISDYLEQNGLSQEIIVNLEYFKSVLPPQHQTSFLQDDWISSIRISGDLILTGSYDGFARILDQSGNVQLTTPHPQRGVKTVMWMPDGGIAAAGISQTIAVYGADREKQRLRLQGHTAPVESLDVVGQTLLSASADATICIWNWTSKGDIVAPTVRKKRQRGSQQNVPLLAPLETLTGHIGTVAGAVFDSRDSTVAYSVGHDATIRTWDVVSAQGVDNKKSSDALSCLCQLPNLSLIALGSIARTILLHDPRAQQVASSVLRGHQAPVSCLRQSPTNDYLFTSASFDSTVRIWDARAPSQALFIIPRADTENKFKVFAVDWSSWGICSGGEDRQVQINQSVA